MGVLDSQDESLQAHLCFRTTDTPDEPSLVGGRELRCHVTRLDPDLPLVAAAAGVYYVQLTEDIGGATGESADIDANVGCPTGGIINVRKIHPFVWEIDLFDGDGGGAHGVLVLSDLLTNENIGCLVNVTWRRVDPS